MERNEKVRKEDSFIYLATNKKIVIPIIQRDYAQGRNDPKAIVVRTRLIDEWINILIHDNLRMDFNYIYGNESEDIFYPVDGQQRLTSLYLLHWYLAHSTNHAAEIEKWQFDYKTRNSASEFFAFLRDAEKSQMLYDILFSDLSENEKTKNIKNEKWYKSKWENDPTVVSCINFLCMLSGKLNKYKESLHSFWERLNDEEKPGVYFTCLNECDNEYAEIDAAKKYTRMNARGKRLTNFENLKAMIDEIEMRYVKELDYRDPNDIEDITNTISWAYDRIYIDKFYQCIHGESLMEKTKAINNETEKWFRLIYYVYALRYNREIPADIVYGDSSDSYDNVIYKISQERIIDKTITKYLYMIKSVCELLCNSGHELAYRYSDFLLDDIRKRQKAIAFVIFVSELWTPQNKECDNVRLLSNWHEFEDMLDDLSFEEWTNNYDSMVIAIVLKMVEGIKSTKSNSVNEYFICNDFEDNNPFKDIITLLDMKCRILERKIKSKLINDGLVDKNLLNKVYVGKRRWGYLYHLCGYLDDWSINDWSNRPQWSDRTIYDYMKLIISYDSIDRMLEPYNARLIYAYASQYDVENQRLSDENCINKCNNEHIWSNSFLKWMDEEYNELEDKKSKQLNHLRTMMNLLLEYKKENHLDNTDIMEHYAKFIRSYFEKNDSYEKCWLRFAVKYTKGGNELLSSELELDNGIVKLKQVPIILKVYLQEMGYVFNEKISLIKNFNRKCTYFIESADRIPYFNINQVCTFAPDINDTGKYRHTLINEDGWDLSGNVVSRNMDLSFRTFLDFSKIGCAIKNQFLSIDFMQGEYKLSIYELGDVRSGKIVVNIQEATIDKNTLEQVEAEIKRWKTLFTEVKEYPKIDSNYNKWIELWNDEYEMAFGNEFNLGTATFEKQGGQRPRKIWSEIFDIPSLAWVKKQELI